MPCATSWTTALPVALGIWIHAEFYSPCITVIFNTGKSTLITCTRACLVVVFFFFFYRPLSAIYLAISLPSLLVELVSILLTKITSVAATIERFLVIRGTIHVVRIS